MEVQREIQGACFWTQNKRNCIQLPFGPAATVPGTLGPGSRQTENQQTRKPARQRSNRPRNQETKKPTRQQTNTTTSKKSRDEAPNQPKNNQKINQKSTKMAPKSVLEAVLGASWGFLETLGPILATRTENPSTLPLVDSPWRAKLGPKIH